MFNTIDLKAVLDQVPVGSRQFAENLIKAENTYGLTEKQAYWVDVLVKRARGEDKPKTESVGDVSKVVAMFNTAKEHGLKNPKIRLRNYTLLLAKEGSKNFGSIYVKDAHNMYVGKIDQTGQFKFAFDVSNKTAASAEIMAFAADPLNVATAYGHLTNSCCFCGRVLSDAESVSKGYGPICAKKFGLAHNAAGKATRVDVDANLNVQVS